MLWWLPGDSRLHSDTRELMAVTPATPPRPAWADDRPFSDHSLLADLPETEQRAARQAQNKQSAELRRALQDGWMQWMLVTEAPLVERMTLFRHNHFTSQLRTVRSPQLMWRQHALLRRHALGNYADLRRAIVTDWAEAHRGALIKSPIEILVGTVRRFDLPDPKPRRLVTVGTSAGEKVLHFKTPITQQPPRLSGRHPKGARGLARNSGHRGTWRRAPGACVTPQSGCHERLMFWVAGLTSEAALGIYRAGRASKPRPERHASFSFCV